MENNQELNKRQLLCEINRKMIKLIQNIDEIVQDLSTLTIMVNDEEFDESKIINFPSHM